MRNTLIALALPLLAACATPYTESPPREATAPAPICAELADLAAQVADSKQAGIPHPAIASGLRARYVEATERDRERNAIVERVLSAVYLLDDTPEAVRQAILRRCTEGDFFERPLAGERQSGRAQGTAPDEPGSRQNMPSPTGTLAIARTRP